MKVVSAIFRYAMEVLYADILIILTQWNNTKQLLNPSAGVIDMVVCAKYFISHRNLFALTLDTLLQGEVNAIKWDPTGTLLASCSDDSTAKVRDNFDIMFWLVECYDLSVSEF